MSPVPIPFFRPYRMDKAQFNQSSVPEEGQSSLKRKHGESDDDAEMSYEPTQEDIRLVVAAGAGDLEEIKSINESGNGDICFQVSWFFISQEILLVHSLIIIMAGSTDRDERSYGSCRRGAP